MIKKMLLTVVTSVLFLASCDGISSNNQIQKNEQPTINIEDSKFQKISPRSEELTVTIITSDSFDYNPYLKRAWVLTDNQYELYVGLPSFNISKVENGEITGCFDSAQAITGLHNNPGSLTGTVSNGIAECQFDDGYGYKGSISLIFKSRDSIEANIHFADIDGTNTKLKNPLYDGTYQFRPFGIKDYKGLNPIESQSFMVNLNSWGDVKFVSCQLDTKRKPVSFLLLNEDGDILYDFDTGDIMPNDVKDVSFQDINNDGLKDIIIIAVRTFGEELAVLVQFQNPDGLFYLDAELNQEINDSVKNKDIKSVTDYLNKKY